MLPCLGGRRATGAVLVGRGPAADRPRATRRWCRDRVRSGRCGRAAVPRQLEHVSSVERAGALRRQLGRRQGGRRPRDQPAAATTPDDPRLEESATAGRFDRARARAPKATSRVTVGISHPSLGRMIKSSIRAARSSGSASLALPDRERLQDGHGARRAPPRPAGKAVATRAPAESFRRFSSERSSNRRPRQEAHPLSR
jgi:hypothetical protein